MTAQMMTLLGAFAAMLAVIQLGLPADTPDLIKLAIAALNAGLSYYLGQTNKGTVQPVPEQKIIVPSDAVKQDKPHA